MKRIIGRYTGKEKGPLLIVFGGMHGNEPAGVKALDLMLKMIEVEPITNPSFNFCGRIIGLIGNVQAMRRGERFLEKDLNRAWTEENVHRVKNNNNGTLDAEDIEMKELLEVIESEIEDYQPSKVVMLDIHTTTAYGGIFSIATNNPESIRIAVELHAPVNTKMLDTVGLKGTSLHYFITENFGVEMVPVVFEAGQHNELLSVNRAIAAITNCMRTIGCVRANDVENRHDSILIEYSSGLPKVAELIMIHNVNPGDEFKMQPDYKNFQAVEKGELLALDKHGEIRADEDGLILMPLYQKQGDDGFFLVRRIEY
jgi:succinylglutamate desuccinylase